MAAEVHLYRLNGKLEEQLIPVVEWQSAIGGADDIRLITTKEGFNVEAHEEDEDGWRLILLLDSSGQASTRVARLMDYNGFILVKPL